MNLRTRALAASRWTMASLAIRAALQFAQTIALARLLSPSDFGLMAPVAAIYSIVALFVDLGLSNALMHFPDPSHRARSTLYWLNLIAACLFALLLASIAWPASLFFNEPASFALMASLSVALPLGAIGQQVRVLAEKDLQFSSVAIVETSAGIAGFAVGIAIALVGGRVYAFVGAALTTAGIGSLLSLLLLSNGFRPTFDFDLREIKQHIRYGSYRLGDALFNSIQAQADILIGSVAMGTNAMGLYSVPRDLSLKLANAVVNPVATRVGLPLMAKAQADAAALQAIYLQTLRMTASVNFPIYAVLFAWADEIVPLILGPTWSNSIIYLRIFAIWGLVRSTGNPVGSLLYATGLVRRAMWWNIGLCLLVPLPFSLAVVNYGTLGLAAALLSIHVFIFYPAFLFLVKPACGISFHVYSLQFAAPLAAAITSTLTGQVIVEALSLSGWERVGAGVSASAAAYLLISIFINRPFISATSEMLEPMLRLAFKKRDDRH